MRSALILALAGLAVAAPRPAPQDMDFDEIDSVPEPSLVTPPLGGATEAPTYNTATAAASAASQAATDPASASKRGLEVRVDVNAPCAPQPNGYGPKPTVDSDVAFLADPDFATGATNAPTPDGYVSTFTNLQGSTQAPAGMYLGMYTLKTYDVFQCQEYCDAAQACYGFNIYYERDPTVNPAAACPNPASFTNVVCALYGSGAAVTPDLATNLGQWRGPPDVNGQAFHVVIAGSNGYAKTAPPPAIPGFTGPTEFGGAINAPSNYIGAKYYLGPYDPTQCSAACQATTAYDHRHPRSDGTYDACNFFNSYVLSKDGIPQGTYCSMYTVSWDKSYSTNYGQYRGIDRYTVSQSYGYTLSPQDPGHI